MSKDISKYPKTDLFSIKDTIATPHPYCITPEHVAHAADNYGGMLGENAIESLEAKRGPCCGVKGCKLTYTEHEQALLVEVKDDRPLNEITELKEYLLSIKDMAEQDHFAGFAFIKG